MWEYGSLKDMNMYVSLYKDSEMKVERKNQKRKECVLCAWVSKYKKGFISDF